MKDVSNKSETCLGKDYETFEHEADIGIRGCGDSLEAAFENAALALYSVMVDVGRVAPNQQKTVLVSAPDTELLLVEWLNALLSLSDVERMVFSKFDVTLVDLTLSGSAWGERLDKSRHPTGVEVKGATYHLLRVMEHHGRYTAECVVDV